MKYPCIYRIDGCSEIYSFDLIYEHQQKCQYGPQLCPVNKLNIGPCTWIGTCSSIKSHLKQAHTDICKDYYGRYQGPIHISGVTPDIGRDKFIFVGNAVFCSCSKIENGAFYSDLHYIGPAAETAKYRKRCDLVIRKARWILKQPV